jgi:hypothetical protein
MSGFPNREEPAQYVEGDACGKPRLHVLIAVSVGMQDGACDPASCT